MPATTTLQKWGNSHGIRLPKYIIEHLSLNTNDIIDIIINSDCSLTLKKSDSTINLDSLFSDYTGNYVCSEYDWGLPSGKEVW